MQNTNDSRYGPQAFQGLNLGIDRSRPTMRKGAHEDSRKERRRGARANEMKLFNDMKRLNRRRLEQAISTEKLVVLNFRMADFQTARIQRKIPMLKAKPFGSLSEEKVHLDAADGSRIVVDLDGVLIFCYFPGLVSDGLGERILESLNELVQISPPILDENCSDRRAAKGSTRADAPLPSSVDEASDDDSGGVIDTEEWTLDMEQDLPSEFFFNDTNSQMGGAVPNQLGVNDTLVLPIKKPLPHLDHLVLKPSAFNLSPGWFPTGMENRRPIAPSSHCRLILEDHSIEAAKKFLESKRLLDYQLDDIIGLIHPTLASDLRRLRTTMQEIRGPSGDIIKNAWTSTFPCINLGFNRTVPRHRDSKGIRGGMDFIVVLGRFTQGNLKFPDLNLSVDWIPGCFGAFDGYDLTHEVEPWEGECRVTLISFLRKSTWSGLNVKLSPSAPTVAQLIDSLRSAHAARQYSTNKSSKRKTEDKGKEPAAAQRENKRTHDVARRKGSAL